VPNSPIMKIQDGCGRHIELRRTLISQDWIDISTKFGGQMHHGHVEMIVGTMITISTFQPTCTRSP